MEKVTLKRSLKLWHIVLMGIGYMTPMVVFDTFGIASETTGGHVPTAYILALVAMLFTAASYGKMIQVFPNAGSAYTYTQRTISPHIGFLVGWAALMDYLFLPMVNALIAQIYLSATFPGLPAWIWVIGFVAIVTSVNIFSVNFTANFNTMLVVFQTLIMVVFIGVAIKRLLNGDGTGMLFSIEPFYKEGINTSALIAGATLMCFSYLGFDAVTTLSEETPNPKKTIPRAIFLVALIGGAMFIITSYFIQSVFPTAAHFKDPEASSPEIAAYMGGLAFQVFFLAGGLAGTLASGVASHASVSRLLYVMGRDSVLPNKLFGYIHPRWRTPVANIVLVGLISVTAVFFDLATAASFINFGALIAFTFVNLSVISYYVVRKKMHKTFKGFFSYLVMPLLGAGAVAILWANLEKSSLMLGIGWAIVGFIYLLYITKLFKVKPASIHFEEMEEMHPSSYIDEEEKSFAVEETGEINQAKNA
ncbi:APC family permease [Aneurinibacillus thermoaerophilus]|uniref:APC family permease n=1 Tax=Aneurinibacillus thermoaerophilus TaxID=143495 RepID=UPI002E2014BA|nr:APC family permease [Aneurinibacillus thermoaerophilus]